MPAGGLLLNLEDIKAGMVLQGILPDRLVTVIEARMLDATPAPGGVVQLTYKDTTGALGNELIYRDREPKLKEERAQAPWTFQGDGELFRLVSEAHRIRLAYLFDPLIAVHTSIVEPLPHQILAVYGEMLPRQPLRFLLADDPGAGKTIMAGLFIKELLIRGDVSRCMIVAPGLLDEQWQDELSTKFNLPFEILTNDKLEAARTGNWFLENNLVICRLDKLSRNEDIQKKLEATDWDLIIVDEAHKMSAHFFGNEIQETKRHKLGKLLGGLTRHLLLMTATPHNGKEEDFQLFMRLLDPDRFEGRFRDGVHVSDTKDLMRRLVKEQLVRFDGTPLFPERIANTVRYKLSQPERELYESVTEYVRQEFNRADALENDGRRGTIGFALTVLQRRLASSPEAIYQSLRRRRERLQQRVADAKAGKSPADRDVAASSPEYSAEDIERLEDTLDEDVEEEEETLVDQATAARTIAELEAEIKTVARLEDLALRVKRSGHDKKWEELSRLLQNTPEMYDEAGNRRKLVIFTEHRDTLNYLDERITGTLLGRKEAVVTIHGGTPRDERRLSQNRFTQDKEVQVLLATDAAGEGINLQRAHLMVNYDLPWNPNRIEQRFGRIHRIGQTEVCHLWNLVADETREGDVFAHLFDKLQVQSRSLGGAVFDILGNMFQDVRLKDLLIESVRYGDRPETKAKLLLRVDNLTDQKKCRELIEQRALAHDSMDARRVQEIREEMERADARRLQPHFVQSFFAEAFRLLGGELREREAKRFEITHVPSIIRARDKRYGNREMILQRYERVTFDKNLIQQPGKPIAAFICPGHPLLDAVIDLLIEQHRDLIASGTVLADPNALEEEKRVLLFMDHSIQDARTDRAGNRRVVSRQMQFAELGTKGDIREAGYAPYLDYRPLTSAEIGAIKPLLEEEWLRQNIEGTAIAYAARDLVPKHFNEVRSRKEAIVKKSKSEVWDRLTKEIIYWNNRAEELKTQELAGKTPRLNSGKARQRADELEARRRRRMEELDQELHLSPLPPIILGGALIVPEVLVRRLAGEPPAVDDDSDISPEERKRIELLAMRAVEQAERALGFIPRDVSKENKGYDIESSAGNGRLRFIEVKGRGAGKKTVTVTKNEILTGFNKPEDFVLAIVLIDGEKTTTRYLRKPFSREPDFGLTCATYDLKDLSQRWAEPS